MPVERRPFRDQTIAVAAIAPLLAELDGPVASDDPGYFDEAVLVLAAATGDPRLPRAR